MTSKTSSFNNRRGAGFLARQRSLAGRRLWAIALTILGHFLYNVVGVVTGLSITLNEFAHRHVPAAESTKELHDIMTGMLGINNPSWIILTIPLAAILAIEGFAWMDKRQEVDFYESLPVSRRQRFIDICAGSFLYYIFSYVITLEISLAVATAMGALTRTILAEILMQAVSTAALFIAVYAVGVLSVMLTGNVIIAWMAFGVLMLYETVFKLILEGYCSVFLATWSGRPEGPLFQSILSPVYHFLNREGAVETPLKLLALAILYFLLSWICYQLRKNELAGTAVVFGPVRSVVRVAIALIPGLTTGLMFSSMGFESRTVISLLWLVLFTVITACIMQIIYEYDFRALFHRPLEIAAAVALGLVIYMVFLFDITGYDRFVPDPDKVTDAALVSTEDYDSFCTEEGSSVTEIEYGERYMHLENVEDVIAVARYGQDYTRKVRTLHGDYDYAGNSADRADSEAEGEGEMHLWRAGEEYPLQVLYRMKNGRTIRRKFSLPSSIDPAMMDAITGTPQYRQGAFSIYHDDAVRAAADNFVLFSSNGKEWNNCDLTTAQYEAFREAYQRDLSQFSYSFARAYRPFAKVEIRYHDVLPHDAHPELENLTVSFPVYPAFDHTIEFLKSCGVWAEPLDYDSLPDGKAYSDLTEEEQEIVNSIDYNIFAGPFNYNIPF